MWDRYHLGIWVAGMLHPSYVAASAMIIGYNASFLLLKHSFRLDLSNKELSREPLDLLSSPWSIWGSVAFMGC